MPLPTISLFGPPGSGKGTLGAALVERLRLGQLDTGALLRRYVQSGAPGALELGAALAAGHMAPTPLVQQLLAEQLGSQPAGQAGWLLDGTPRNPEQAMWMLGARSRGTMRLDGVLVLDVPPDVLARRIAARVVCGTCGRIGAGTGGPCTSGYCSGVLAPRPEDQNAEATARRQAVYLEQTTPALRILQHAGVPVVHLDGNRPMEEVVDDALRFWSALRSLTQHPQAATR